MPKVMPDVSDIVKYENGELDALESAVALQIMINSGQGWRMQGSYGRAMMDAIKAGDCMLGEVETMDYWGNAIPARGQLKKGTFGSREYVVARHGEEWAKALDKAGEG